MGKVSLQGVCDMHVHTNPDLRWRAYDDFELADAAIHFALMSYAAGVASSRYVTLLRQRQEAREEAASAAHAKSKERAKKEKEKD